MKNFLVVLFCLLFTVEGRAQNLKGFEYGHASHPEGNEWESPGRLGYNKEQPRAVFFTFEDLQSSLKVLPENSRYWRSLDGNWKFNWVPTPEVRPKDFYKIDYDVNGWDDIRVPSNWNIEGIQKDGSQKYGTPIYVNQPVIFWHEVKPGDWKGGVMRTPPQDWTTYKDRNEVGSYRRNFTVPSDWKNREVYINFDGVDSFFYLWINGEYVGFSKNSRNAARFNITRFLKKGENTVAVEVYRNSDGSFLEAQDMFRLPGIFRSVYLTSTNSVQIRDIKIMPDLTANYTDGTLGIVSSVRNLSNKEARGLKIEYHLFPNRLYSDEIEPGHQDDFSSLSIDVAAGGEKTVNTVFEVKNPHKWSAEQPWRYTLVAQLKDKKGKVLETVSTYIGFRKVEILDTPADRDEFGNAGRYFYINGSPVKLKGVNRHETDPSRGHAVDRRRMEEEVMMMKRANINHVRNSHYPDAPYWYYLAGKYGLYLEDEANLESHEYYYGDASLSHVPEWEDAHVARNMEMVHSGINQPAIVLWSLGNEAGPGRNFVEAYNAIKGYDTSRPVQYERNNDIVDIGSNQYPSIAWVNEAVEGKMNIKYPFHISEYAHSMGNAVGNLIDYWNAIESTNYFMGGAIWDWIDQSLYNYDASGRQYLAFGGDFGDRPNDGQFVMNGILFGDLLPKPQYWEVKKVYQNVAISPKDISNGEIEIFNKNYFTSLGDYSIGWELLENGKVIGSGVLPPAVADSLAPRKKSMVKIPLPPFKFNDGKEYFLNIYLTLKEDKPWAKAGYIQMAEQIPVKEAVFTAAMNADNKVNTLALSDNDSIVSIQGKGFLIEFDNARGTLSTLKYGGKDFIIPGKGPQLDVYRAYVNNDNWVADQWFTNGLYNLQHTVKRHDVGKDGNGNIVISYLIESQAPGRGKMKGGNGSACGVYSIEEQERESIDEEVFKITTQQIWTVYNDGSVELNSFIDSNKHSLTLPRLGYTLEMPVHFNKVIYYGRGPEENYADRKTGQFIGKYETSVSDMFTSYTRPQSNGNREEVRWAYLSDSDDGLLFIAPQHMSFSALPYTETELFETGHPYKLSPSTRNVIHLDYGVTGLGGASCGQGGPLATDRIQAAQKRFSFIIRNAVADSASYKSEIVTSGLQPLGISRNSQGMLTIDYPANEEIEYSINNDSIPRCYKEPFKFKEGGVVKAWLKNNPSIFSEIICGIIDTTPIIAIYASSEEPDYGEAANLTDDDPGSIWHTMYSVTVAQFPHWVDFDAGESKTIKGISYLPRQDQNSIGMVKGYEIYVTDNLDDWGEPVVHGEFSPGKSKKVVNFSSPVSGRYIRFKALNAHDGREYATGAEFSILTQ